MPPGWTCPPTSPSRRTSMVDRVHLPPRWRFGLPLLGLLLLAGLPAASAAPMKFRDVEIGVESEPRGQPFHGYTEFRLWVRNHGSEQRRVRLVVPASTITGRGSGGIRSIGREITVDPGRVGVVSLLQPAAPDVPGSGATVFIDGRKQEDGIPLATASGRAGGVAHSGRRFAA